MSGPPSEPDNPQQASVSVIRLERDEWIIVNVEHPTITTRGDWLADVAAAHRARVRAVSGKEVDYRYLIGDPETSARIAKIRAAGASIAALRHQATVEETELRRERTELMHELADLRLAPSEIARVAGVPATALPDGLGTDRDARLARRLLRQVQRRPG